MIIGFFFGFDAYTEIPEGQSTDTVVLKRGGEGFKKLNFAIRCDRFSVDYYADGTPKVYRSDLSFTKNGSILQQSTILVNHPATFEGIRFYQASYGTRPSDALIIVLKGHNQKSAMQVAAGSEFELPGKEGTAKILRMEGNFMRMGPAVKIQITSATQTVQFWVFQNIEEMEAANPGLRKHVPMFNPALFPPYDFSLAAIQPKHYTGVQVNHDPGVPMVIVGAVFLVAGFIVVFFYAHRQVWVGIDSQGGKTRVSVSGKSNKDSVGINREIFRLIKEIQKTGVKSA
jgi:cytochrome c biogenesis protein